MTSSRLRRPSIPRCASVLAALLVACGDPAGPAEHPFEPVAGVWGAEAHGVRFHLTITESLSGCPRTQGQHCNGIDANLGGAGWLIFGAPAESLAVEMFGFNDPSWTVGPIHLSVYTPAPPGGRSYQVGSFNGYVAGPGTVEGTFRRPESSLDEAPNSPLPGRWPAASVPLRLTRR